ncbi:MAG: undecaprenyl-diphosphate phosphatase [Azoarcus sp.]|jgi:undecaprenyl-diphosphatase|nr:undecaprenyl-diphosphate phosphatase [Azoarcus sp.]
MDFMQLLTAFVLGIVEGVTEFLPVSSTGHLIIAGDLLGYQSDTRDAFEVVIQFPAILAVCWIFRAKLAEVTKGVLVAPRSQPSIRFVLMLLIAFLPAAVLGVIFHKTIKEVLFNPLVVAAALIIGGLLIIVIERLHRDHPNTTELDNITTGQAVKIGFMQALAMIPGTSRSGATIIGGLVFGLSRRAAAEFSFFLAIPTMFGAMVLDVYKHRDLFTMADVPVFAVGCITSFLSAMWAVRFLLRYISTHTFVSFAYYRIAFGLIVIASWYFGFADWSSN